MPESLTACGGFGKARDDESVPPHNSSPRTFGIVCLSNDRFRGARASSDRVRLCKSGDVGETSVIVGLSFSGMVSLPVETRRPAPETTLALFEVPAGAIDRSRLIVG